MGDAEDRCADDQESQRRPGRALPQRDGDGDDGGEPDQARGEVEDVPGHGFLADVVDEAACDGLVGGRKRVGLPHDRSHRDSSYRVECRVEDDVREDQRPRDGRGTTLYSLDEEPDGAREPGDEEELADVQSDEEPRRIAEVRVGVGMEHPQDHVQKRGAEQDQAADELPIDCHRPSRRLSSKNPTTRRSYSSGAASIAPTCPPGATQSSFGPCAAS